MAGISIPDKGQRRKTKDESAHIERFRFSSFVLGQWAAADRRTLALLISLSFIHGLLYLALMPPWQHYDEPTHFEYAALIVRHPGVSTADVVDLELKWAIADSMYRHRFWGPDFRPALYGPLPPTIGYDQEVHPRLYYALIAIPIGWVQSFPIEVQLAVGRLCSVVFLTLSVLAAWRITVVLAPDEPLAQICLPLLMLVVPSYNDIMSAVNNDVLVNCAATIMFLGCALLVRDGLRPTGLLLATLALLVALMTKRTGVVLLVPYGLALLWACCRQRLRWRVWGIGFVALVLLVLTAVQLEPGAGQSTLQARPWLLAADAAYLRLDLGPWLASLGNWERSWPRYQSAVRILFESYWLRLGWSHVAVAPFWGWLFWGLLPLCGVGLLLRLRASGNALALWQRRVIWLLFVALMSATLSALLRIHPLPADGAPRFLTGGRYAFFVLLPLLWLLALGWQAVMPARWRRGSLPALVGIFALFDASVWAITIPSFYYWPVVP